MIQDCRKTPRNGLERGKASADSFTILIANLVAEYAVDFWSDLLLDVALGSTVSSEDFVRFLFPIPRTDRIKLGAG
jgi:hypothetical protein